MRPLVLLGILLTNLGLAAAALVPHAAGAQGGIASRVAPAAPLRAAAAALASNDSPPPSARFRAQNYGGLPAADATIAAGPSSVITAANSTITVRSLTGTQLSSGSLVTLFNVAVGTDLVQPRITFDPGMRRFILTALGQPASGNTTSISNCYLAVSSTATPDVNPFSWRRFTTSVIRGGLVGDNPSLGYDQQAIYITYNMISPGTTSILGNALYIFNKAQARAGTLTAPANILTEAQLTLPTAPEGGPFPAFSTAANIKPVEAPGGTLSSALLVSSGNPAFVGGGATTGIALFKISTPLATPVVTRSFITTTAWSRTRPATQPFGSSNFSIDPGDDGLQKAVYLNNVLWTCHTVVASQPQNSVKFYRIDPDLAGGGRGSLIEEYEISDFLLDYYQPTIMPDNFGNAMAVFHGSDFETNPSIYHSRFVSSRDAFEQPTLTVPGQSVYTVPRTSGGTTAQWGRHTDAAIDVTNGTAVWVTGEIAIGTGIWETWAALVPTRYTRVLSPNGGETILDQKPLQITWIPGAADTTGLVDIDLSRDSGATWTRLITGTPDNGIYATVATLPFSSQCRVRVAAQDLPAQIFDISDNDFTITDGGSNVFCATDQVPKPSAVPIPDNWKSNSDWAVMPLFFPSDQAIRGADVSVDISHPFISDLEVELIHPDGSKVLLHNKTGGATQDLSTTYPAPTVPADGLAAYRAQIVGKRTRYWDTTGRELPWILRVRDLKPGDVGRINNWCLTVYGPDFSRIHVSTPNGGEKWEIGGNHLITWTNDPNHPVSGSVAVEMSRDNGATYSVLGTRLAASGTFNWSVSGPPTQQALVRVRSIADAGPPPQPAQPAQFDVSDAVFTIDNSHLQVLSPNGGEKLAIGSTFKIRWDPLPPTGTVKIELSRDSDSTYPTVIAAAAPNSGSFDWVVPSGLDTTNGRIRITSNTTPSLTGKSAADFAILTFAVRVLSPNGGETWYTSNTQTIRWVAAGVPGDVNIEISRDPARTDWTPIATVPASDGAYDWPITGPVSSTVLIRITSVSDSALTDISDGVFAIADPSITVTAPADGERWVIGSTYNIKWTAAGIPNAPAGTDNVDIEVSRNGGPWEVIFSNVANTGSATWIVTGPIRATNQIRVRTHNFSFTGFSGIFAIAEPFIRVLTPNGGESLAVGKNYDITWDAAPFDSPLNPSNVNIRLSLDDGLTYPILINESGPVPNNGKYTWRAGPGLDTPKGRIQISLDSTATTISDTSDGSFSITTPSLSLFAPNGGEVWYTYTRHTIRWRAVGITSNLKIELSRNPNRLDWAPIGLVPASAGSFDWTVTTPSGENNLIRITSVDDPSQTDKSDRTFAIVDMGVRVTSPSGGEVWGIGTTHAITWTTEGVPTSPAGDDNVDILISRDGGTSFTSLFSNVANTGSQTWTVTGAAAADCLIRVQPHNYPAFGVSAGVFRIVQPSITVGSPNGAEQLRIGYKQTIRWSSSGVSGNVKIELSRDNGTSWITLFSDTANDGNEDWTVTGPATLNGLLRITSLDLPAVTDTSDAPFPIIQPRLTVTRPNGGERWYTGSIQTITWTNAAIDASALVKVELIRPGGTDVLFNGIPNTGSVDWTVATPNPGTSSIRVSALDGSNAVDSSDGTFTILAPTLRVTSPNGGEEWLLNTRHLITWTSDGVVGTVNIELSRDGGGNWEVLALGATNNGSFPYQVAGTTTGQALVRVIWAERPEISDQGNSTFRISQPDIQVTSPGAGAKWQIGSRVLISWTGSTVRSSGGSVDVQLSRDKGKSWTTILRDANNTGTASWTPVTGPATAKAVIRVVWKQGTNVSGSSPVFQIVKPKKNKAKH